MSYHNAPTNDSNNRLNLENKALSTIKRTCHRSSCDIGVTLTSSKHYSILGYTTLRYYSKIHVTCNKDTVNSVTVF